MSLSQRLAWLEAFSTLAALGLAILISFQASPDPAALGALSVRLALIAAVCIVSFHFNDLYNFEAPLHFPVLFARLCRALGSSALLLAFMYLAFPAMVVGGNLASHGLLLTLVVVLGIRATLYSLSKHPGFAEAVVIMGNGALAAELAEQIRTRPDLALRLVGFLGEPTGALGVRLGGYGDIAEIVGRHRPNRIIVAMADRRGHLPVSELLACRVRGVRIEEGVQAYERFTRRLAVESLTPSALIFGEGFHVSRVQLAIKRVISVVVALVALTLAAPVMALVAVLIKLDSPGPVFFIQERVGLGGRVFRLIKFRTMRGVASEQEHVIRDNTSRVTRLGAVLRKYRLDEVPQFINVLRGEMSVVGPRPEIPSLVAAYSAAIPWYHLRHEVRPGLTGWAQIRAGYTMGFEETKRKICYDLYYIKHMSVAFDLRILFATVKFVLCGTRPG